MLPASLRHPRRTGAEHELSRDHEQSLAIPLVAARPRFHLPESSYPRLPSTPQPPVVEQRSYFSMRRCNCVDRKWKLRVRPLTPESGLPPRRKRCAASSQFDDLSGVTRGPRPVGFNAKLGGAPLTKSATTTVAPSRRPGAHLKPPFPDHRLLCPFWTVLELLHRSLDGPQRLVPVLIKRTLIVISALGRPPCSSHRIATTVLSQSPTQLGTDREQPRAEGSFESSSSWPRQLPPALLLIEEPVSLQSVPTLRRRRGCREPSPGLLRIFHDGLPALPLRLDQRGAGRRGLNVLEAE